MIYGITQQVMRQSANDPQIQIADDVARALSTGNAVNLSYIQNNLDIAKSLATFVTVYNESNKPIISSAGLNGSMPKLSKKIFDETRRAGQKIFTWQPQTNVRDAVVLKHFKGKQTGFVLVGRSLREVEKRERQIFYLVLLGWAITNLLLLGWLYFFRIGIKAQSID